MTEDMINSIMGGSKDQQLDLLDTMFIRKLIKLAMSEETTASELSIIQKYLKDNGVTQMFKPKDEFIELANIDVPFLDYKENPTDISVDELEELEKGL